MLQQLGHLWNMLTHHGRLLLKGGRKDSDLIASQRNKIVLNEDRLLAHTETWQLLPERCLDEYKSAEPY